MSAVMSSEIEKILTRLLVRFNVKEQYQHGEAKQVATEALELCYNKDMKSTVKIINTFKGCFGLTVEHPFELWKMI